MYEYSRAPNLESLLGTINEDEAVRDKCLRVRIYSANKTGGVPFAVDTLESPPFSLKKASLLILLLACALAAAGGLLFKFYVPWRIGTFLHYPSTDCTVVSYTTSDTKNGILYNTQVEYYDSKNISHTGQITFSSSQFTQMNLSVNATFICTYQGSFLIDKKTLEDDYSQAKSQWFLGLIIPVAIVVLFGSLVLIYMNRKAETTYYSRTYSFSDDEGIKITNWASIPPNLQQYFYVLLRSYYNMQGENNKEISFQKSPRNLLFGRQITFQILAAILIMLSAGAIGFGGYTLSQYDFDHDCIALALIGLGISIAVIFKLVFLPLARNKTTIESDELFVGFYVSSFKGIFTIYGTIVKRTQQKQGV